MGVELEPERPSLHLRVSSSSLRTKGRFCALSTGDCMTKTFLIWDCSPCWLKLKEFVYRIIMDPFTDLFLTICIILNINFLALEHYPMSLETSNILSIGNVVRLSLSVIFSCNFSFSLVTIILIIYFITPKCCKYIV